MIHNADNVIRKLLIDLGLGTDSEDESTWPVYHSRMFDTPDNAICVTRTAGRIQGRDHTNGNTDEIYGIQIRVRGETRSIAEAKANLIALSMDTDVLRDIVELETYYYLVQAMTRIGSLLPEGYEGGSQRYVCSLNYVASIDEATDVGSGSGSGT